ncbi:MAG TPA: DUF397 domain-containing protein [Verrucomicrobiae bacterium]|nr:DUF397 domain-containing protein [Verrucomicrobiae bacterium]
MSQHQDSTIDWLTSSFSDGMQCVETAVVDGNVVVRDTKDRQGPTLTFTRGEWDAFVEGVKNDEFNFGAMAAGQPVTAKVLA